MNQQYCIPLPRTRTAHTIAILLQDCWAVYDSPSELSLAYAIQDTILVITISCKSQAEAAAVDEGAEVECDEEFAV